MWEVGAGVRSRTRERRQAQCLCLRASGATYRQKQPSAAPAGTCPEALDGFGSLGRLSPTGISLNWVPFLKLLFP